MNGFFKNSLFFAALAVPLTALAETPVVPARTASPASISGQPLLDTLGDLMAAQKATEAELAQLRAKCGAGCKGTTGKSGSSSTSKEVKAAKARIDVLERDLAILTGRVNSLAFQLQMTQVEMEYLWASMDAKVDRAEFDELVGWVASIDGRVTHLEEEPDAQLALSVGTSVMIAGQLPGQTLPFGLRAEAGVRYTWKIDEAKSAGLLLETGLGSGGVGVRLIPSVILPTGVGVGAGAGYACDGLWTGDQGCSATHAGGVAQISFEGGDRTRFQVRGGAEFNSLAVPDYEPAAELRAFAGVSVLFGRAPVTITLED
jgi:hypothetical protein